MFEVKKLNIKINDRYIIKDFSLTLNPKDKLAIIGEEGNGKSTLLKSLLGICEYAEITGSINSKNYRIGYLKQSMTEEDINKKVILTMDRVKNKQIDGIEVVNIIDFLLE